MNEKDQSEAPKKEHLPAMLRPLKGFSDEEVVKWLGGQDADHVEVLAPNFISVQASLETLEAAKGLAEVEVKRTKQYRRR